MTFDSLPTELKLNILEGLHIAGTQDRNHRHFTNALRACKDWNELGAPLLWTYIAINNDNLLPFVRSLGTARNTTGAIVRNLSIKLNPMPQGALFSLSLTRLGFPSDHWDDEIGAELDLPTYLPKLSDSRLPRFLRHHSNGTSRYEDSRYGIQESNSLDDKNDMCRARERVLPRLTHLHLEGESISPFVFSSLITGPTLRNLQS
jgi:hypothetical protein